MANKIIIKKSSVAAKIPLATDLEVGEIAGNLEDQKLYSKKPDGTVVLMGSGLGGTGDVEGPSSATDGAVALYDGTTGKLIKNGQVPGSIYTQNANNVNITGGSISGITDLAISDGGTGASTASAALSNLGGYPDSNPDGYTTNTGTVTSVSGTGTVNGISLSGTVNTSGNITLGGALSGVSLTAQVTGTLPIANGGTNATTAAGARTSLGLGTAAITDATDYATAAQGDLADTALQPADVGTIASQNANNVNITGGSVSGITDLAITDGGTGASTAAGARLNLGLGTIATQNSNNVSITGGSITGITSLNVSGDVDVNGDIKTDTFFRSTDGGSPASPSIQPGNDNDTGMYLVSSNVLGFTTGGSEVARFDSAQNFFVAQADTSSPGVGDTVVGYCLRSNGQFFASSGSTTAFFNRNANGSVLTFLRSGSTVGSISITTTTTSFNTSSDYRLKENLTPITNALARVAQIPVYRFNFKADPDKTVDGFVAHDLAPHIPEAVTGEKDGVDEDGNPVYQGVDQSKPVPLLTAAIQELLKEVNKLKARVEHLENQ